MDQNSRYAADQRGLQRRSAVRKWYKEISMPELYITGDLHGDTELYRLDHFGFPEQDELTRKDLVLVAGDFGAPWTAGEDERDRSALAFHEKKCYTTLFIDGNHENFPALYSYPEVTFLGARCHQLREHVLHVMRGEVLHTKHHRILCMGGACSVDKMYRKEGVSWWPQEIPTEEEWEHCMASLEQEKPDLIVTHEAPCSLVFRMHGLNHSMEDDVSEHMEEMLYRIGKEHIGVTDWYFGHHHIDRDFIPIRERGIRFHALFSGMQKTEQ